MGLHCILISAFCTIATVLCCTISAEAESSSGYNSNSPASSASDSTEGCTGTGASMNSASVTCET